MIRTALFMFFFAVMNYGSFSQTGPGAMLPDYADIPGWRPAGALKIYSTETMRNMAITEADLILEYGLYYAVERDFYNFSGKLINVKVFTMDNTFGSYGVFLHKSKGAATIKEFGNSCFTRPGEYAFWKHIYFVTMYSRTQGDTITDGFRQFAGFIDSRIRLKGEIPDILNISRDKPGKVTLLKGPLSLANVYYFSPLDVFHIKEGIAIENGDEKEIILKYSNNNEAVQRLIEVAGILSPMSKFSDFILIGDFSFAMKDKQGKAIVFKVKDNCLGITIKQK